jgi:hypothetical protein
MTEYPHWLTTAQRAVYIAVAHVTGRTLADASSAECLAIMHDPRVLAAETLMSVRAEAGNLAGTQQAAQLWNRRCRETLTRLRQAEETQP